jgi:iron complex outermembrane recepter protein
MNNPLNHFTLKKIFCACLFSLPFLYHSVTAFANPFNLYKGKISDEQNQPMAGVSVQVKGTATGTITDANGEFEINANEKYILIVSFIGYKTLELVVGTNSDISITMEEDIQSLGEVIVLGSRGFPRTATESPVPIDAIMPKDLKSFAQVNVGDILNNFAPSFNSNRQTVTDGTDHLDPASLRGLGPDQVLVLVNGKRRHTSALVNINGSVGRGSVGTDMNVIPVAAIERIEVLRDGAAAQYGSDAIAGVINVVLKKNYNGLSASLTTGAHITTMKYEVPNILGGVEKISEKINDGAVVQFDLNKGFAFGNKGGVTLTVQYNERARTNRSGFDNAPTIYLGTAGGFPATPGGQTQTDFRNQLISDDAQLVVQNNYDRQNMIFGNSSSRNLGVFLNGDYQLTEKSNLYFSAGYAYRTGKAFGNNRIPVSRTQQPLTSNGTLYYPNGFLPAIAPTIHDPSIMVGYKTRFGQWQLDIANTLGQNKFQFAVQESGNASLADGTIQTEFDAGALSFAQNTTNIDLLRVFNTLGGFTDFALALGGEFRLEKYTIAAGEENSYIGAEIQKSVPTAPITINGPAAGTTLALPGAQVFPGFQPTDAISKGRNSQSIYVDVQGELFGRWLLNTAARFENYSDFGSKLIGKFATRFKFNETFSLRGSVSSGFRAPSLHQRYFQNTSTQFVSGLPSNTLTVNNDNPIARNVIGVDALRPETSVNLTVGSTASYGGFSLTIDAYQIKIQDRIVYSGAFSRAILGFAATDYPGINNVNFFANAANTTTTGLDIVVAQKVDFGKSKLSLTVAANFNKNEVTGINSTDLINDPAKNDPTTNPDTWFKNRLFDRQQQSRIEVLQPQSKINMSATYSINKFDFVLRMVRFGEIAYVHNLDTDAKMADGSFWNTQFLRDADGHAYIDQTFAPLISTDLTVSYHFSEKFTVSLGANNLFDVYPDQIFVDSRNAQGSIDYSSGRDASNRGRFLFLANQGGFNGRFVFLRLAADL